MASLATRCVATLSLPRQAIFINPLSPQVLWRKSAPFGSFLFWFVLLWARGASSPPRAVGERGERRGTREPLAAAADPDQEALADQQPAAVQQLHPPDGVTGVYEVPPRFPAVRLLLLPLMGPEERLLLV